MRWCALLLLAAVLAAADVVVGPGHGLLRIEDALAVARSGDTVVIHHRADGQPYRTAGLHLSAPGIALRGVPDLDGRPPAIDGGALRGAAAIITVAPTAEGTVIRSLRLTGARAGGGAAAILVDGADRVAIESCEIADCDTGVRSRGGVDTARDLVLRDCRISGIGVAGGGGHHAVEAAGGGVRIVGCRIAGAVDGSAVLSRAFRTLVEASVLAGSGDVELALLDAPGTERAGGLALVLGCVLAKRADCPGDRGLVRIAAGKGGDRALTAWFVHCTLETPFAAPAVTLAAPSAKAAFANCIVADPGGGGAGRRLLDRGGRAEPPAWAAGLWLAYGYADAPRGSTVGAFGALPPFVAGEDRRLAPDAAAPFRDGGVALETVPLPAAVLDAGHPLRRKPPVLLQPHGAIGASERTVAGGGPDLGAYETPEGPGPTPEP